MMTTMQLIIKKHFKLAYFLFCLKAIYIIPKKTAIIILKILIILILIIIITMITVTKRIKKFYKL